MKVIHIIENLDISYGGPAKSVPLLVKYLELDDIENVIFTIELKKNESNNLLEENNLNVKKFPLIGPQKIKYSKGLYTAIESSLVKDSIIHVHSLWNYPSFIAYRIAKKYNIPLVVSVRGTMYTWALEQRKYMKKFAMALFQKKMLQYASSIHITEKNESKALKKLGIYNNCLLVPNGIELEKKFDKINVSLLKKINYSNDKFYIMFLGRIVHNKGIHYLINSYIKLQNNYANVEILIVGGVEEKKYYNSLIKSNGVHFLGILDGIDKHTIFEISSLFVLPSLGENFGMSIAEAMSYKLPVVTTTGTPWESLKNQKAGWWIELNQENVDSAIEEALNLSKDELKYMGEKSYEIIKDFTWTKQSKKMKKYYLELLGR